VLVDAIIKITEIMYKELASHVNDVDDKNLFLFRKIERVFVYISGI
jgi:hypothetical protein